MKSRGTRAAQPGGANISQPMIVSTSTTFTPNSYPFKYKVYLFAGGANGNSGATGGTTNFYFQYYGGGGGSGKVYIDSSTQTLTSGSLTFTIGAAPARSSTTYGGSTTVTRNDNAVVSGAYNTSFSYPYYNGAAGSSGGGAGYVNRTSNNTGNSTNYAGGYAGFEGGPGVNSTYSSGGQGSTTQFVSVNGVTSPNRGNDTKLPAGGDGYSASSGDVPTAYAGVVINSQTYLAGTNYGKGGNGAGYTNNSDMNYYWNDVFLGGPGVAILEPIP